MATMGKYVYGILNSGIDESFDCYGVGDAGQVHTIPYQDISALVSDSEVLDYIHMPRDSLAALLVRHQEVVERIMNLEYTIVPMKLGAFAKDRDEIGHILAKGHRFAKDIFHKIVDKIEIDVVATWSDLDLALKEAGEEREIKEFRRQLLLNRDGITVDEQIKAGFMIKKALEARRDRYASHILSALKTVSEEFNIHELMDDKMVMNSAFLVDRSRQEDFDREIQELDSEFNEKLHFRCVGPLPSYSFYTLEIRRIQFGELDWARRKLGLLDGSATKHEISRAYHRLAFTFHPDTNPDNDGVEKEFDDATKAYRILCEYCQGNACAFNEDEFEKNAILVKVRE